jgi:hypothetical protein
MRDRSGRFGVHQQRGFWLRCFLGGALFILAAMGPAEAISYAQCVYPTIRVSKVQGVVFDPNGEPIRDVAISLKSDDRILASATTDEAGRFSISATPGKYDVGTDLARAFVPTRLFMILDPGMKMENCTFTTTSHRKFEMAVREFTQSSRNQKKDDAVQR